MQCLSLRAKRIVIAAIAGSTALIAIESTRAASIDINANNGATTYYVGVSGSTFAAGATGDPGNTWNNIYYESTVFNTGGVSNSQSYGAGNIFFNTEGAGDIAYPGTTNTSGYFYDTSGTQLSTFTATLAASFANSGGQAGGSGGSTNDLALFGSSLGGSTSGGNPGGYPVTVALNNIPAAYQASGYNIYVYYTSGNTGHTGYVTDGPTTYYISNDTAANNTAAFPGYVLATSQTNSTYTSSDYAEFTNLSGSSANLTLEATLPGGGATASGLSLAGIQIVQIVPEPASIGLLGAVGAAALLRRRRYRAIA